MGLLRVRDGRQLVDAVLAVLGEDLRADILFLKHVSSIFRQSSNPVRGFSMMKQVRLWVAIQ